MEAVNKYHNGKIYKIIATNNNKALPYFGSTIKKYLSGRMNRHREDYRNWKQDNTHNYCSSFELFKENGIENCKIILVENFKCNSRDELRMREQFFIDNNNCTNIFNAYRTEEQQKEYKKEHYEKNKEIYKERGNKYYEDNKDQVKINVASYREKNKDKIKENKSKIYNCKICDCNILCAIKKRHERTKKHLANLLEV